ncbi:MAG: hypothetical protein AAF371_11140 [Pseudomonadota bacterium]
MRFDDARIAAPLKLAWWDWSAGHIAASLPMIEAGDIEAPAAQAAPPEVDLG